MAVSNFISRRNIIYPFFVAIAALIIFAGVYLFYFSQVLAASDATLSVQGSSIVLKMKITNTSNHVVSNPEVIIIYGGETKTVPLKSSQNSLAPHESYDFVASIPINESKDYTVFLSAPFNRPIKYSFALDSSTIKPVKAVVDISSTMIVGRTYDESVRLCNVSNTPLFDVRWTDSVDGKFFAEEFVPRQVSLQLNECKNLYATLTPIIAGKATMTFSVKVGDIVNNMTQEITITPSE